MAQFFLSAVAGAGGYLPILLGPLKGYYLPLDVIYDRPRMLLGHYESDVVSELLSMKKTTVAYDIGAHIGFMSLALARLVGPQGKVFAFEPIKENVEILNKVIHCNDLASVIRVVPRALCDRNGSEKMIIREASAMHLLKMASDGGNFEGYPTVTVETRTLDTFVLEQAHSVPDLIKIDAEGAEPFVLQGGLLTLQKYSPVLLIEVHGGRNALATWDTLAALNYSWTHLTEQGHETITAKEQLVACFSPQSWSQHFLLRR
jgi:FkbM family methyltransferase